MVGTWKNVEELESFLNIHELEAIVSAQRDRESRNHKFLASLKGIDLDKESEDNAKEKFQRSIARVQGKLQGKSKEEVEMDEFGLDFEIEE